MYLVNAIEEVVLKVEGKKQSWMNTFLLAFLLLLLILVPSNILFSIVISLLCYYMYKYVVVKRDWPLTLKYNSKVLKTLLKVL